MIKRFLQAFLCLIPIIAHSESWRIYPVGFSAELSNEVPFQAIDSLLGILKPGDSLLFIQGTYHPLKPLKPVRSGTSGNPIYIGSVSGHRVVLHGKNLKVNESTGRPILSDTSGIITIKNVSHIIIEGLEVWESSGIGISIAGKNTRFIDVLNCKVHHSYNSGIGLWYCEHVKVLFCEVTGANNQEYRTVQRLGREAPHEAISIAGARYFEVAWNHVHNCHKEGIDCKEVSAYGRIHHNFIHNIPRQGIYLDSWFGRLHQVEVNDNTVFACEWGIGISGEGQGSRMDSILIHHNLIFENRASGILFGVWGLDEKRTNIYIFNNTIWRNGSMGHWAGKTGGIDLRSSNMENLYIFNNLIFGNWSFEIASALQSTEADKFFSKNKIIISNNLLGAQPEVEEPVGFFQAVYAWSGNNTSISDPGLSNPETYDFSLKTDSPAWKNYLSPVGLPYSKFIGAFGKETDIHFFREP